MDLLQLFIHIQIKVLLQEIQMMEASVLLFLRQVTANMVYKVVRQE